MKKAALIIFAFLLLVATIVRVVYINVEVQESIAAEEHYQFGETVPLGDNYFFMQDEAANGYTISVDSSKIITTEEFMTQYGYSMQKLDELLIPQNNDYIYLIEVTVTNKNNDYYGEDGVNLFSYKLVGPDYYLQFFDAMLGIANPKLQGGVLFTLKKGTSIQITIPFMIDTQSAISTSIDYVKSTSPDLLISQYPVKQFIAIE